MQSQCTKIHLECDDCGRCRHAGVAHSCYVKRATQAERFWERVDRSGGPKACWLWSGPLDESGHGRAKWYDGKRIVEHLAHRIAWRLLYGPAGSAKVCHDCPGGDNAACCNPAHLWLGTQRENALDTLAKGRVPRGEAAGLAKLTTDQVLEVRRLHDAREPHRRIAKRFGISLSQVSYIGRRKQWRHVPEA